MNDRLVGLKTRNIKLGTGIIESVDDNYIVVDFNGDKKQFVFPDAFERFLTIEDGELLDELRNMSAKKKKEREEIAAAEKEKKAIEREQLGILDRGSVFLTHNEVLNDCFECNNKGIYRRAFKVLDNYDKCAVWFPKIAYKLGGEYVSNDKAKNYINILTDNDRTIIEKNEDMQVMADRAGELEDLCRFVFGQFEGEDCYRFLGVFKEVESNAAVEGKKYVRIAERIDLDNREIL